MLAVGKRVDGIDALLDARGAFEIELRGRLLHLFGQLVDELLVIACEKPLHPTYVLPVFLRRYLAATGART